MTPVRYSLVATLIVLCSASPALAQLAIDTCAPNLPNWLFTTKIVTCIENAIGSAVIAFTAIMSSYLKMTSFALFCMAFIFFGIKIMLGEQELNKYVIAFMLRFAIVVVFSFNLGGFVLLPFALTKDMILMLNGGWLPWIQIDLMIGRLFGFAPGLSLFQGVLGLIGAGLFSASTGISLFLVGVIAVLSIINFAFRAVYTYLLAVVLIAFMVIISPLIIPLAIFQLSERYFKKWLDMLIAAMLMPPILFGFLRMFMAIVEVAAGGVFGILGGNDFRALWRNSSPLFSWALVSDPAIFQKYEAMGMPAGTPISPSNMNPLLGRTMQANLFYFPNIDFGGANMIMFQELVMAFLGIILICYLMITMINHVPQLSDSIAGVNTGIGFERIPFMEDMKGAVKKVASKGMKGAAKGGGGGGGGSGGGGSG